MKNDRFNLKDEDAEHTSTVSRDERFGYLGFSPRWLQFLNNPWCFLLGIAGLSFGQALAILGVLPLVMPEIEKRFNFSSSQIGMIAAANDVAAVVFGLIVSHYGNFGNKIKWIGFGGIVTGLGFLIVTLPHYIIEKYNPPQASFPDILCNTPTTLTSFANTTTTTTESCDEGFIADWYYLAVFVLGQFFSGLGSISLFSLTPSIFFKSCSPKTLPIFIGLWQFSMFLGAMVAFGLTGPLLALYVDIKQPEGFKMTPKDPRWIGNWWIGILGSAAICFISSIFLLGFPSKIKNNSAQERQNLEKDVLPNLTVKEKLKKLPSVLKELLTNWTFLFNSLAMNTSLLYGGGLAPFFAKILILRYGVEPEKVGPAIIISTIPPLLIGLLVGSLLPRVFKLEESGRKSAFFCFLFQIITIIGPFAFLIPGCEEVKLAGWQVPYGVRTGIGDSYQFTEYPTIPGVELGSTCNQNCGCHLGIALPVCGADNVSYLSPCYAGCSGSLSMTTFGNCSCIASNDGFGGAARIGSCDQNCKNWILFLVLMSVVSLAIFLQLTPSKVVLMRCLRPEDLSFAFGLQYFSSKVLAHIPGPVLFGHVVDLNCVIWQKVCDKIGYCLVYDMDEQMKMITTITGVLTGLGTLFYMLSWLLYKEASHPITKDKNKTPLLESVVADENMKETKL